MQLLVLGFFPRYEILYAENLCSMSDVKDVDFCSSLQLDHQHQFLHNLKVSIQMHSATLNAISSDQYLMSKELERCCLNLLFLGFHTNLDCLIDCY